MEKFSAFRDVGTGIMPFLHPIPPRGIHSQIFKKIIGHILAVLKLPFIIICVMLLIILQKINSSPVLVVKSMIYRVLLWFMGFYKIESVVKPSKKQIIESKPKVHKKLIISNYTSYVDILYFSTFSPIFLSVCVDGTVKECLPFDMILNCTNVDCSVGIPLDQFLKNYKSNRSIILFPEGTTSNGRGILSFLPVFRDFDVLQHKIDFKVAGIKYTWENFCPTFTTGSLLWHFWNLISQFSNHLCVYYLNDNDLIINPESGLFN
jgi:hypothetical protein